jgi:uncharacterized membrane protein
MSIEIRLFKAQTGLNWFKAGWELFKCQPGTFISMHLLIGLLSLVALLSPILQLPATLLMPFITAGFYHAMLMRQQGQKIEIFDLFKPLTAVGRRLMLFRLGLYHLFGGLVLAFVTGSLFQGLSEPINAYLNAVEAQNAALVEVHAKQILASIQMSDVIVLFAALSFYTCCFAYTIPLIYFSQNNSILACIKASLLVFWHNAGALTVFGLISAALIVFSAFLSFIPLLVIMPILYLGFFVSFQAMFMPSISANKEQGDDALQNNDHPNNDRFDA